MKKLFCILFCLSLLGCQSENEKKTADMIPQDKMVRILADIHTTEALIESNVIYPDTALMTFNQEQEKIFDQYGVTQKQFKDTYNYYLDNLSEMDVLYEIVVDTLTVRESKLQAKKQQAQDAAGKTPALRKAQ